MIVVLKGLLLPSSPFGPDHFRSWPGPLLTGGAATAGALPDRSAKNLRIGRTFGPLPDTKVPSPAPGVEFFELIDFRGAGREVLPCDWALLRQGLFLVEDHHLPS
jgi:hypothetical protein